MALDLFASAKANADAVRMAFESLATAMPLDKAAVLRDFADWVRAEGMISVNLRLLIVVELLNGGTYQNIYEWAAEQSRLCGRPSEDLMRERLGAFYDRRVAFDRTFVNGEQLRYGALNAGGVGLPEYAPYCVILSKAWQASLVQAACLPGDSLKICYASDGSFDPALAGTLAAPADHMRYVAAKERADEVLSADKSKWPQLVVSPGRYFELIFIGKVSLVEVACVRVLKAAYERTWDLAFADFTRKLGDAERALVHDFVQLQKSVVSGRIKLEIIA